MHPDDLRDMLKQAAERLRCQFDGGLCSEYVDGYEEDERCHCPTCSLYKRIKDELGGE